MLDTNPDDQDPVLQMMRDMGLPDPGTAEALEWVYMNITRPSFATEVSSNEEEDYDDDTGEMPELRGNTEHTVPDGGA